MNDRCSSQSFHARHAHHSPQSCCSSTSSPSLCSALLPLCFRPLLPSSALSSPCSDATFMSAEKKGDPTGEYTFVFKN